MVCERLLAAIQPNFVWLRSKNAASFFARVCVLTISPPHSSVNLRLHRVYTIIISVDLARGLHQSFRMQTDSQRSSFECRPHLVFYHCLGVGYGVLTTILFRPLVLELAGPAGAWCWSNDKTWSEVM